MSIKSLAKHFKDAVVSPYKSDELAMIMVSKTGDQKAFNMLYNKFKKPIYNYCLNLVKRPTLAEELTHETFLKVFRYKEKYEEGRKFSTWLWTIARNTCFDHLKAKDATNFLNQFNSTHNEEENNTDDLIWDNEHPEVIALKNSENQAVRDCLEELPLKQRDALSLRLLEDSSYEELTKILELSVSAIKSLLNRARKSLMLCVKGKLE